MTKSNWRDELYLGERVGGAGTLVRQGIKVGGKKGGRAVQKGQTAAVRAGQGAKEKAKQAKNLAEQFKSGSTKISDDATVVEGYRDPGFSLTQEGSAGFGGLIGTVGGAIVGGAMGNPMMGAQLGGKVGSYF